MPCRTPAGVLAAFPALAACSPQTTRQAPAVKASGFLSDYSRLAQVFPEQLSYVFNVGSCYYVMGDSAEAARWFRRAASLPDAPASVHEAARRTQRFLEPEAPKPAVR